MLYVSEEFHGPLLILSLDLTSAVQPLPQISPATVSPVHLSPPLSNTNPALKPVQTSVSAAPGMGNISADPDDEEGLKHLEQVEFL